MHIYVVIVGGGVVDKMWGCDDVHDANGIDPF